jgi:hypothetical protein
MAPGINPAKVRRQSIGLDRAGYLSIGACLIGCVLASTTLGDTARIKRISLMTRDLDRSIAFFTEVVGFSLDFEGTLAANGEPFLGPVFNIDASQPIRRALLSTSQKPRGKFERGYRTSFRNLNIPRRRTIGAISSDGSRFSEIASD